MLKGQVQVQSIPAIFLNGTIQSDSNLLFLDFLLVLDLTALRDSNSVNIEP